MLEYQKEERRAAITDEQILENANRAGAGAAQGDGRGKRTTAVSKSGIVVNGMGDLAVRFSRCCAPVPGDEIVGFVTRGRGISIHRTDCINIINLTDLERSRLIDAEWCQDVGDEGRYMTEIKIYGKNRTGLLVDITKILSERQLDISSVHSSTSKQEIVTLTMAFETRGKDELNALVGKIRQVEGVIDIERTRG